MAELGSLGDIALMKRKTVRRMALGVGLALLVVAITLRFMGVARPILMLLHLVSLGACGFALLAREKPEPKA